MTNADAPTRLFIYGTLAPGRANHYVVHDLGGTWQAANLRGDLVDEGWGAGMGYPAIVPREDGPSVEGFVLSAPALAAHWPRLDAFEGEGYERVVVTVTLDTGERVDAQVYALRKR
ncbi:MAG: gamma-glutamylcyclotransferase family protein [Pseudomonadota bacterium]